MSLRRRCAWALAGSILVLLAAEGVALLIMRESPDAVRWYDEAAQLKVAQMDALDDIDLVFAGTSMAWQAFVPTDFDEVAGTSSYNAGLNGGTPEVMEPWLLEQVIPRLHPTTVVWGLSSYDLAPAYGASQRETYDQSLEGRTGMFAEIEQATASWSSLVRNRTVLRSIDDSFGSGADEREMAFADAASRLGLDGERRDFRAGDPAQQQRVAQGRLRDFSPDRDDLDSIRRTVRALADRGVTVILVDLPVPASFVAAHPNGAVDYARTTSSLEALAATLNVRLIRHDAAIDDDDFVDFSHLSEVAAKQYSRDIAGQITGGADEEPAEATTTADALAAALDARDQSCNDEIAPIAALGEVAAAVAALESEMMTNTRPPSELALIYALAERGALVSAVCSEQNITGTSDIAGATAHVTAAIDSLYAASENNENATNIWGHAFHREAAEFLRQALVADRAIDTVVIGNSIPRTGIDPVLLGEVTDTTVANVSTIGSSIETLRWWIDEVVAATDPSTVVLTLGYYDLYALCSAFESRSQLAQDLQQRRADAFVGLVAPEARRTWDHLLGPLDAVAPITDGSLGRNNVRDTFDPDALLEAAATAERLWQIGTPCAARIQPLREAIEALRADGREVVVVSFSPLPSYADDQPAGFDGFLEQVEAFAVAAGVRAEEWVPLHDRLPEEMFADGVHYTAAGREHVTNIVGEALDRAG